MNKTITILAGIGVVAILAVGFNVSISDRGIAIEPVLGAGGDVYFNDLFVEGSDTELSLHSPDTGDSWTQTYNAEGDDTFVVEESTDNLRFHAGDSSAGAQYDLDATYASADYQMEILYTTLSSAQDDMFLPCLRCTGSRASSGYSMDDISNSVSDNPDLVLITGASSCTVIDGPYENGQSSPMGAVLDSGDVINFQVLGDNISVCNTTDNHCFLYAVDGTVTAAEKAIMLGGRRACDTGGDFAGGHRIDNVKVIELGDTTQGWSSPTTNGEINNDFTDPANAYSSDGSDASFLNDGNGGPLQDYGDFGFTDTDVGTIRGVQILGEWGCSTSDWCSLGVAVSNDNGSTWSATQYTTLIDQTADAIHIFGHGEELWGLTWTATDITDTDFRIRIEFEDGQDSSTDIFVDHIQAKIVYDEDAAPPVVSDKTGEILIDWDQ